MIKINDIRIGNTLLEGIVAEILPEALYLRHPDDDQEARFSPALVHPIPLTKDHLLEQYGFAHHPEFGGGYFHIPGLCLKAHGKGWRIYSTAEPSCRPIYYRHELENLYYSLYDREITESGYRPTPTDKHLLSLHLHALRLGNLIFGKNVNGHKNQLITVRGLTKGGVVWNEFRRLPSDRGIVIGPGLDYSDLMLPGWLDPVPLTKEHAERCGFTPINSRKELYRLGEIELLFSNRQVSAQQGKHHFGRPFQYLHQLQNLIFSLTGSELHFELANFTEAS